MCAPSEKFLNMGGTLAIGLGLVFASNIGKRWLYYVTCIGTLLIIIDIMLLREFV